MIDALRRLFWYALSGSLFTFVALLVIGQAVETHASSERPVVLRDEFTHGIHRISGIVPVDITCAELSVRAEQLTGTSYRLLFETWQDPALDCVKEETPRWIKTVVFTDAEPATFIASMDGEHLPLSIQPYAQRRASSTDTTKQKP